MSLTKSFAACNVAPATKDKDGNPTMLGPLSNGIPSLTSFFIDSSGHSSFTLPLELKFASKDELDIFLTSKCVSPLPENYELEAKDDGEPSDLSAETSFVGFEVKSSSADEDKPVVVEAISVISSWVKDLSVCFNTELTVRAANHDPIVSPEPSGAVHPARLNVLTKLEITPVLTVKKTSNSNGEIDVPDLLALELGAIPDHMQKESSARIQETRLDPVSLNVTLTHAFTISVKSVEGPSLGTTMVSLTIRHANSHREPVNITNIALHPGHSRHETASKSSRGMMGAQHSVTNMTKAVQWGYAPQTELSLPLSLQPHDAYSTILTVAAGEEVLSRHFISPVSVTGVVGQPTSTSALRHRVVVAADAHWTTQLVAVEPADAFRINMSVKQSEVKLGEPMVVSLRVFNLSLEPRNLMLLMAKSEMTDATAKSEAVNAAVVSDIDGYTFGVWGISGEDDGTVRLTRDHELLAVDGALLLGEVLGQHAVDAELRFVPLKEGRLKVPNWKLYDKSVGKWYTCVHNLSIIASSPNKE